MKNMRKGIHPEYGPAIITCLSCNTKLETFSTKPEMKIEICSNCHPYYTGEQRIVDTAGQVERFMKRRKIADKQQAQAQQKSEKQAKKEKEKAEHNKKVETATSNQELLELLRTQLAGEDHVQRDTLTAPKVNKSTKSASKKEKKAEN